MTAAVQNYVYPCPVPGGTGRAFRSGLTPAKTKIQQKCIDVLVPRGGSPT